MAGMIKAVWMLPVLSATAPISNAIVHTATAGMNIARANAATSADGTGTSGVCLDTTAMPECRIGAGICTGGGWLS